MPHSSFGWFIRDLRGAGYPLARANGNPESRLRSGSGHSIATGPPPEPELVVEQRESAEVEIDARTNVVTLIGVDVRSELDTLARHHCG
ncbi:hypothetical protein ACNOYE_06100 [Nannocystaceae bacterium ST9]